MHNAYVLKILLIFKGYKYWAKRIERYLIGTNNIYSAHIFCEIAVDIKQCNKKSKWPSKSSIFILNKLWTTLRFKTDAKGNMLALMV